MENRAGPFRSYMGLFIVLALILAVYLSTNLMVPHLPEFVGMYVVTPLLWLVPAATIILMGRGCPGIGYRTYTFAGIGLLLGIVHISILIMGGLMEGFTSSSYVYTSQQIFMSLAVWLPPLLAIELVRGHLLKHFRISHTVLAVGLITLFMTFVMIPLSALGNLGRSEMLFPFLGGTFLPVLSQNLLAGALVLVGGPLPAILYRGSLEAFHAFSPVLPDMTWMLKAFLGTLAPIIGYWAIISLCEKRPALQTVEVGSNSSKSMAVLNWTVPVLLITLFIWASIGVVGFRPVTIISGSMKPAIDVGDLVIVRSLSPDEVKVGDVIQFSHGDGSITTVHRVIDIQGQSSFVTKGDANRARDASPVSADQVIGRVDMRIPKVGWVPIYFRNFISSIADIF